MNDSSNTDYLMLPGWKTISIHPTEHDTHVQAELTGEITDCPNCVSRKITKHDKRPQIIMDQPARGKRVGIHLERQRYKCGGKKNHVFSAPLPECDENRRATSRLIKQIEEDALHKPFTRIADEVGLDESTIRDIFMDWVARKEAVYRPKTPKVMGIDDLFVKKEFSCVLTNIDSGSVIDILPTREKESVKRRLAKLDTNHIEVVAMDMWIQFRQAVKSVIPHAIIVIDKFHVLQVASRCMDRERIAVQHRSPEFRKKLKNEKVLLYKKEAHKDMSEQLRFSTIVNTFPELGLAHAAKERFDLLYQCTSRSEAEKYFEEWKKSLSGKTKARFQAVLKVFKTHGPYIFNYFDTDKVTNAYTESANKMIRWTNLVGRGYSFNVLRAKMVHTDDLKILRRPPYDRKYRMNLDTMSLSLTERDDDYGTSIVKINEMLEYEAKLLGLSMDDYEDSDEYDF